MSVLNSRNKRYHESVKITHVQSGYTGKSQGGPKAPPVSVRMCDVGQDGLAVGPFVSVWAQADSTTIR